MLMMMGSNALPATISGHISPLVIIFATTIPLKRNYTTSLYADTPPQSSLIGPPGGTESSTFYKNAAKIPRRFTDAALDSRAAILFDAQIELLKMISRNRRYRAAPSANREAIDFKKRFSIFSAAIRHDDSYQSGHVRQYASAGQRPD